MRTASALPALLLTVLPLTGPPLEAAGPAAAAPARGKVFLTLEEALELAFPGCEIEDRTAYLSEEETERASELAGEEVEQRMVRSYVGLRDGAVVGTAYFEAHRVRTMRETVMFVVDPEARIARVELLAFAEPEEYIPRGSWYGQFVGRPLDDELRLDRGIRAVAGATLTARATTGAARRVLALDAVLRERVQGSGGA